LDTQGIRGASTFVQNANPTLLDSAIRRWIFGLKRVGRRCCGQPEMGEFICRRDQGGEERDWALVIWAYVSS